MSEAQTLGFATEVNQLLHLVIHSLYSNKEIFLRELVSNASDALEKLRTMAITHPEVLEKDPDLKIRVAVDREAKTIQITDNGIGMNKEDAISHLGTIAKSGTKEFLQQLSQNQLQDNKLIGQFGVGFYSAFIVADKVTVESRKAGEIAEQGVRWESSGENGYTIATINRPIRGTTITLHLKEEESEFLEDYRLRAIITKYSDHIEFPILMLKTTLAKNEEGKEEETHTEEVVNRATALWTLPKSQISDEDYINFYKHISHDFNPPLAWAHNKVEGTQEYSTLLYIPEKAPFDLYYREFKHGVKLYVKRVFIMDEAEQFLPNYLRFVRGIVDSNDLPLNISREILQSNRVVNNIKQGIIKRILSLLESMASDEPEKYAKFWQEFGAVLKEGPAEDYQNREQIARLLRFSSSKDDNPTPTVSLTDYVARMQLDQKNIYYITAETFTSAKNSPHLELLRQKGIEVLLLHDRVDEWLVGHLTEFEGKTLQSAAKGELALPEEEVKALKEKQEAFKKSHEALLTRMLTVLAPMVKDIRVSTRLTQSPACLIADEDDMGGQLKRILAAAGQDVSGFKPIMEINSDHPLITRLDATTNDIAFDDLARFLYEQALLAEGGRLDDPAGFVAKVNRFILGNA